MAENRLHLIHIHSAVAKVPDSNADLKYGEIAVQYATSDPALYIKKADNTYAKFVPNIDISGTTTGSGNVVTGVSVSNNMVTAALGNVVDSATGDSLISATVSGGTKVVVSATTDLTTAVSKAHEHSNKALLDTYTQTEADLADAVAKKHEHDNKTVLDGITSGKVESWDEAAESAHTHANKALLDTYTQTEADLADAVAKKHEHTNKSELDLIESGDKAKWDAAAESAHTHDNKSVLDGIDATDVANWDSAYDNMLSGITSGTCGDFVQVSIGAKSDKTQSVGVAVTTGATSAATASDNGLATAYETKQYIDKQISAATESQVTTARTIIAGDMLNGGGNLSADITINHDTVSYSNPSTAATGTITDRKFRALTGLAEDGFGHVTSATQSEFTLPAETQLSKGTTTGSGNVVTDLSVNDHQITLTKGLTALTAVTATGDSYVSASVASNSAITVGLSSVAASKEDIAGASATGSVADAKAVKDYVEEQITSSVQYCGATSTLPTSTGVGDLYIASAQIAVPAGSSATGSATTAETGDYLISRSAGKWDVIEKNLTGAVTSSDALTANALVVGNGNQTVKKASQVGDATHPIYINASGVPVASTNAIQVVSAADGSNALAWNSAVTLATITIDGTSTTIDAKLPANPNTDTATTETGHYAPQTVASTAGTANSFIRQITLDSKKHVIDVVTGSPAAVAVVDCASTITTASTTIGTIDGTALTAKIGVTNSNATIPMSASTATTLATVGGVNITAKASMNKLTIAGAAANASEAEFNGTSDVEIAVLDCGEY